MFSESLEPFNNSEAVDFKENYLAGYLADHQDVDPELVKNRTLKRISNSISKKVDATVHHDETRVIREAVNIISGVQEQIMYPIWLLSVDYAGKTFRFAMNGQTGKMVGEIPLDKTKLQKMMIKAGIITFILSIIAQIA